MDTLCNKCNNVFSINLVERQVDSGVVQEFTCTFCSNVYGVAFITHRGIKLREHITALRGVQPTAKNKKRLVRLTDSLLNECHQLA